MEPLPNVCFEHIKDTYCYGIFEEFKLVIDKDTGYFNATKLCKDGGKKYRDWSRMNKSKKLIEYYREKRGVECDTDFSYDYRKDNHDTPDYRLTGTYVPRELILDIASWISIEFYDKCSNIVLHFFITEYKKMDKTNFKKKIKKLKKRMEKLSSLILEKDAKITELEETIINQEYIHSMDADNNDSNAVALVQNRPSYTTSEEDEPEPKNNSNCKNVVCIKKTRSHLFGLFKSSTVLYCSKTLKR